MLSDSIINSIFECLLGYGESGANYQEFNDNTIEASLKLTNKIGHTMEAKKKEASSKKAEKVVQHLDALFARFEHLQNMKNDDPDHDKCSNRVRLLIQNMFENKASNWQKSKKVDGKIKKKDDIENEVMRENQDKKRGDDNRGGDRRGDYNDRRGDNYNKNDSTRTVYQAKRTGTMDSTASSNSNARDNNKRGGDKKGGDRRYNDDKPDFNRKQSQKAGGGRDDKMSKPREPIEEENLKKLLGKYFQGYYAKPEAIESEEGSGDE